MLWHTAIRLTVFECAVSRIDLCPVTSSPFRDTRYRVYLYVCLLVCLSVWMAFRFTNLLQSAVSDLLPS